MNKLAKGFASAAQLQFARPPRGFIARLVIGLSLLCWSTLGTAQAQDETSVPEAAVGSPIPLDANLQIQIQELSSPSYRTRELARWRLEQTPSRSIAQIENSIHSVDHNSAAQLIDLLSAFAMHADVQTSLRSKQLLRRLADKPSSVGRLASNTLNAIADLQEQKAMEVLRFHGAQIDYNLFTINGQAIPDMRTLGLKIDDRFDGGPEIVQWIRFLKSVEAVYLIGPKIDSNYYAALAELTRLRAIKLKHVEISAEELRLFRNLMALEHMGLNYVDVDDDDISAILELPMSRSLRLYGTKISAAGELELNKQLDGLEIYRGNGGFLGVGTANGTTLVTSVVPGSGADDAGIRINDRLMDVNDVPIANFDDLRKELGKHSVGDSIALRIKRMSVEFVVTSHAGRRPELIHGGTLPFPVWINQFRRRICRWYDLHRRDLPWRQTSDAYAIWISETMLQQTQVATVVDYYQRFMQRFPTATALAQAQEDEVLELWAGLGYYRRARQLHAAAGEISERFAGEFPDRFEDVLSLPGIGRYTAGAIMSIAFDARAPIVEANTARLYSRLLALREPLTSRAAQQTLWEFAQAILPKRSGSGRLNQATMELGSQICRPLTPNCQECPLRSLCPTFNAGLISQIPAASPKKLITPTSQVTVLIERGGQLLMRRNQAGEWWQGLWDFPQSYTRRRRFEQRV